MFHKSKLFLAPSSNNYYKGNKKKILMTTSKQSSKEISLEMKSEVHYKKAEKSYRKSEEYIKMINLYPTLKNALIDCRDENLVK